MLRCALYARYSSDHQREASIEDQLEVCRRYVERQGWTMGEVYADQALSGASRFRPAFQQMQADAEQRRFDVLVVEALDRLSRKLADVADLHDRLNFLRIGLHTVATGEITPMHVGMLGTMAQMYLKDLAEKTRRGQLGRALKGRIPGGKAYGYDVLPAGPDGAGERRINPAEAAVVQRIFALFAAGTSPRAIAKQLNAEAVLGPDGRDWRDTTIRGQLDRGTGIIAAAKKQGLDLPTGLVDVRIHDLRHSFASGAVALGESLPMIGKLLGHTQVQTTARYAHLAADPVKAAAERVSSNIAALINAKTGEVVQLLPRIGEPRGALSSGSADEASPASSAAAAGS
jgi:DNA invertase Pin-like site-specific DNA recombinase